MGRGSGPHAGFECGWNCGQGHETDLSGCVWGDTVNVYLKRQDGVEFWLDVQVAVRERRRIEHAIGQLEALGDLAVVSGLQGDSQQAPDV